MLCDTEYASSESIVNRRARRRQSRSLLVALSILVAACKEPAREMRTGDADGCYVIATGKVSSWLPRSLLSNAPSTPVANFYLVKGMARARNLENWGVMFNQDTSMPPMTSNWRVNKDRSITLTYHDVDWGYRMQLQPVGVDSIVGTVKFAGDFGTNGEALIRGRHVSCDSLRLPAQDSVVRRSS